VATNEMRREAAKRKLANQQKRRAERARRQKQVAVISSAAAVVVVVAAVVLLTTAPWKSDPAEPAAQAAAPPGTVNCQYPADGAAAKPANPPQADAVSNQGTVPVSLTTSAGAIGLTLDRAEAPCTVHSFTSLASQGYFDDTPCHRLTTGEGLKVLQCGDPSGQGTGGPGYTITDEPPTGLAPAGQPGAVIYPRGTVAMAKTSAPNSGGSQFFLVYADSTLPPDYTVFGTIDEAGLATIDKVAAAGTDDANGPGDGKPKTAVTVQSATVAA
jgi:peptidyl-prolyl cis-trans isomerase B (cyclophilin B)